MDELTAFVRARLDEDEALANAATAGPWGATGEDIISCSPHPAWAGACAANAGGADGEHIARHDPARVLREVAAMRAMLASLREDQECLSRGYSDVTRGAELAMLTVMRNLAAVWSDHPDYRAEWA